MSAAPKYYCSITKAASAVWGWLWVYLRSFGVMSSDEFTPNACSPSPARNRAQRHIHAHFQDRTQPRDLPAARNLAPFYKFGARYVTPGQFMERLCRLSCSGRIEVYRIPYWTSRLTREAFMAIVNAGLRLLRAGLWRVHLWPY